MAADDTEAEGGSAGGNTAMSLTNDFECGGVLEYSPDMSIPEPYDGEVDSNNFSYLHQQQQQHHHPSHNKTTTAIADYRPQIQLDVGNDKLSFISNTQTIGGRKNFKNLDNIDAAHNDINCWWCCHGFDWHSVMLPVKKRERENGYDVVGNFCSPECCVAFLMEKGTKYGDMWMQYAFLHDIYSRKVNGVVVRFKQAPPRESLSAFGGPYSIGEFRRISDDYVIDAKHTLPPLFPSNGFTEEVTVDYGNVKPFIPMNKERMNKATEDLKLKRNRKKSLENTLDKFMNLKVTTAS
jgi:hypothetical protein